MEAPLRLLPEVALALAAVVLAAGKGVRMHSPLPKVVHPVCGKAMVCHVLTAVGSLSPRESVMVVGVGREAVEKAVEGFRVDFAVQEEPLGTADALRAGLQTLGPFEGTLLVVPGDTPLLTGSLLRTLLEFHESGGLDVSVLTFHPPEAGAYGRVVRGEGGKVLRIVEAKDATPDQLAIREVNSGIYCFRASALSEALPRVKAENAQGEYYLPDVVELLARGAAGAVEAEDPSCVMGINSPAQLMEASSAMRSRILAGLTASGASIVDPLSTYVEADVEVGEGTTIHPFTVVRRGVQIGKRCSIGPFTHLREGTVIGDEVWVGAFVETKEARLGDRSTAGHLIYLGDAVVGSDVTVGAGAITANFDGREKHRTVIEDRAMIGSGTILVAPVRVGKGAVTGAGGVVTRGRNVAPGEMVVGVPARPVRRKPKPGSGEPGPE